MFGPGDPSSAPRGWTPSTRSPGRSARQLRAAGYVTPGDRLGSWRGSSSSWSATNGSVGMLRRTPVLDTRALEQPVHERVVERLPRGLDDVLTHADRGPRAIAVGRVDEDARDGAGALRGVQDSDLVVGEVHAVEGRVPRAERGPQRGV